MYIVYMYDTHIVIYMYIRIVIYAYLCMFIVHNDDTLHRNVTRVHTSQFHLFYIISPPSIPLLSITAHLPLY